MSDVNDRLVVQFPPELGMIFKGMCLKFCDVIHSKSFERKGAFTQLSLGLDRPDSLDEGETGRYENKIDELEDEILTAGGVIIEKNIARFRIPKGAY